jgi:hypothetical protein
VIRHDDGSPDAGLTTVHDRETAVVARLEALATRLDGEPDPGYRARARARLVAMAAVRNPEPTPSSLRDRLIAVRAVDRPPSRWRSRMTAALAGSAVGVTGLAALVAVAAGAQPGDPLYDLKRGTEQTQLALAGDSRGQTLLELARTRLEELELLADDADELIRRTLRTMDAQTTEGAALLTGHAVQAGNPETLDELARWTAEQSAGLDAIRSDAPEGAAADFAGSAGLLDELTVRAAALRSALECSAGPAVVGDDALGPVPGLCPTDAPPPVAGESPAPAPSVPEPADPGAGTPPEVDAGTPATPSTPDGRPGATPPPPGQSGGPTGGAPPTPGSVVPTVPTAPPLPLPLPLPLPGSSSTTSPVPTSPPVVAVPLPGPLTICLPPLATIGKC